MIELEQVTRAYGAKVAVDRLDLIVPRGQLFAFLGPNGAGKTTTIKMLVGLLRPSSGRIRLGGFDMVADGRRARRILGYVPDEPRLYDKLSGREFLSFIAGMYTLRGARGREAVDRSIADFELESFVDELCENYSLGMKQRLVFASALLHSPEILVIDEPMVGLDPRTTRLLKDMLRRRAAGGMCIFMSTHILSMAEQIADRVGIVHQGKLRALGTIDELRRDFARQHTALEDIFLELTSVPADSRPPAEPANAAAPGEDPS